MTVDELSSLIRRSLQRSKAVEVDGLGVFARDVTGRITFRGPTRPRVFIAYANEDEEEANHLYDELTERGFAAWLDRRKLLPGQNWPRRIEDAIESSDFFIACFSRDSVKKRGGFQVEIRFALNCAERIPLDEVFLIPVRLNECSVPVRIQRETEYVDLFPDWDTGFHRVLKIIDEQIQIRRAI
ncbi:MAG TPA: toll/interleukin-1 receptor domain-containing protein [Bryobacteraceae bacterium]|jgi:hypothetical protein|nr:toll/interleukin-1 receptor domain-containing protein [Bryobacteraceae bacterium]